VTPQARSGAVDPGAAAGDADILAGESAAQHVDALEFRSHGSHILVPPHSRPMFLEHGPTKRIDLHLPRDLETGARKSEIESADPAE
jgi:hypothetical protein